MEYWLSFASLLIGVANLFLYFRYDRKIKMLEKRRLEEEINDKNRADFSLRAEKIKAGIYKLVLLNYGKADARNVKINLLNTKEEVESTTFAQNFDTYQLINSNTQREAILHIYTYNTITLKYEILWDDNLGANHRKEIHCDV